MNKYSSTRRSLLNTFLSSTPATNNKKDNLSVDNESKCQILSLIYPYTSPALPHIYIIYIIYLYTELAPKYTATASIAESVERWSRDPGSRVQFPAGGLGVAFFATGPGWVLKCISF